MQTKQQTRRNGYSKEQMDFLTLPANARGHILELPTRLQLSQPQAKKFTQWLGGQLQMPYLGAEWWQGMLLCACDDCFNHIGKRDSCLPVRDDDGVICFVHGNESCLRGGTPLTLFELCEAIGLRAFSSNLA